MNQPTYVRIWLPAVLARLASQLNARKVRGSWRMAQLITALLGGNYVRMPYVDGLNVWACLNDYIGHQIWKDRYYEPEATRVVAVFMQAGYSFIDIGANIGLHTLSACHFRILDTQRIFAFEPEPLNFAVLQENCTLNGFEYVHCSQIALGSKVGKIRLLINEKNRGAHTTLPPEELRVDQRTIVCGMTTLDQMFLSDTELQTQAVLIKIDVEGAELNVINGGLEWIRRLKRAALIYEVPFFSRRRYETNEISCRLFEAGFRQNYLILEKGATGILKPFSVQPGVDTYQTLLDLSGETDGVGNVNVLAIKGDSPLL